MSSGAVSEIYERELGDSVQRFIAEKPAPATWRRNVALAYSAAAKLDAPPVMLDAERSTGTLDVLVDRIMAEAGYSQGMERCDSRKPLFTAIWASAQTLDIAASRRCGAIAVVATA